MEGSADAASPQTEIEPEAIPEPAPSPPEAPSLPPSVVGVDPLLETLQEANMIFNAPATMNYRSSSVIKLLISRRSSIPELKALLDAEGEKHGGRIKISTRMEARLSSTGFEILPITDTQQGISVENLNEWKWEIEAIEPGRQRLHLVILALLDVDGTETPRTLRTFERVIEVEVLGRQRIGSFVAEYWQWLFTAILVPFVGWLFRIRGSLPWRRPPKAQHSAGFAESMRAEDDWRHRDLDRPATPATADFQVAQP
ncbi:MAG: hypothetical protein AAF657_14395 [Acidobacteriota bacterium]